MSFLLHLRNFCLIALAAATFAESAQAVRRFRGSRSRGELRARLGLFYGNYQYNSGISTASPNTQLTLVQPGLRADIEGWIPRTALGVLLNTDIIGLDYSGRPENFRGKPMYYGMGSVSLAYRMFGSGGVNNSEFVLSAGPALVAYPDVTTHGPGTIYYDLVWRRATGLKGGARTRIAFGKQVTFEFGAYYVYPQKMNGGNSTLSRSDTTIAGGSIYLDYHVAPGISYSIGYDGSLHRLSFTPTGSSDARSVQIRSNTGIISILFSL